MNSALGLEKHSCKSISITGYWIIVYDTYHFLIEGIKNFSSGIM